MSSRDPATKHDVEMLQRKVEQQFDLLEHKRTATTEALKTWLMIAFVWAYAVVVWTIVLIADAKQP